MPEEIKREKYISCPWIESGLCFYVGEEGSNIKLCCYKSSPGGADTVLIDNYKGEKIDWDLIFQKKRKLRDIQKNGGTIKGCQDCIFLKEDYWPQEDFVDNIMFDHFTKCNCDCSYCYTAKNKKKFQELKTYNVLPIIKDMYKKNILKHGGQIGFGGGEPVILPEFDKLVDFLIKKKFKVITVPSSGIKFSKILAKGIHSRQVFVFVSLDSSSPETYKKIKRVDKYNEVCKNIIKYAKAQPTNYYGIMTKYIIIPRQNDTIQEIENWLQFNKKNGIADVSIDIEENWSLLYRTQKPEQNFFDIINYVITRTKEMNFNDVIFPDRIKYILNKYDLQQN